MTLWRRPGVLALVSLATGLFVGSLCTLLVLTGCDEVDEQVQAFRFMRAQARYWDRPPADSGPRSASWRASIDIAIPEASAPMSDAELRQHFGECELLERCAANGVQTQPRGSAERRPRSLSPEGAARFVRALHGDAGCGIPTR